MSSRGAHLHGRLVLRFALILTVTLLSFDLLASTIRAGVFRVFGLPTAIVISNDPQPLPRDPANDSLAEPDPTRLVDIEIVSGPVEFLDGGGVSPAGDGLQPTPGGSQLEVLAPDEAETAIRRMRLVAGAISWGTTLLVASLLSVSLSRLVTGPLRRLSQAIEILGPEPENADAVRPLPRKLLRGSDEIAQLARVIQSSRARIAALLETLTRRDRARREWIAHASHDLRTPLTALSACFERAEQRAATAADGPDLVGLLRTARDDCDRLHELADDLLALARLETEEALTPEPLLAVELARRAIDSLQPLAAAHSITLDPGPAPASDLSFDGQGRAILRVLENLLRNALDHASAQVTLSLRRTALEGRDQVRFAILDDGPGFPSERSNTGIGLRVATRFIELHGGRLDIQSHATGAEVSFQLPTT